MKTRRRLFIAFHKSSKVVIPDSIDLKSLLKNYPPERREVNFDNLLYLINLLYKKSQFHDGYFSQKEDGFIPLSSKYLRKISSSIKLSLDYLMEHEVVLCDNSYMAGVVCKGYKINEKYLNGHTRRESFSTNRIYNKFSRSLSEHFVGSRDLSAYPYLIDPFKNGSISIDGEMAIKLLEEIKEEKIAQLDVSMDYDKRVREIHNAFLRQKDKVIRITKSDYDESYGMDNTSNRFHSLITNLKKELRPLLTLNGHKSISLDLKNSQPFFMLLLFKERAYLKYQKNGQKLLRLYEIEPIYTEYIEGVYKELINPLMLQKSSETLENTAPDFYQFLKCVREGSLYDYLLQQKHGEKIVHQDNYEHIRHKFKSKVLTLIYDINRDSKKLRGVRRLFKAAFPTIYDYLTAVKYYETGEVAKVRNGVQIINGRRYDKFIEVDSGYKSLAILLQKIESEVILKIVCKKVKEQFPEFDFLTVHDNIIVPEQIAKPVKRLMMDTIAEVTEEQPQIKLE